jgi:hypothetical protein
MRKSVVAVAVLLLSAAACIEPSERRPGTQLSGQLVAEPVTDWSFTRDQREILIETRTPYWIPHSVTISCADADGQLFIGSRNPVGKRWVNWVERDPNVRLKIVDRLYEVRLARVTDAPQIEKIRAAYAAKRERLQNPPAVGAAPPVAEPETWYWRVEPRG